MAEIADATEVVTDQRQGQAQTIETADRGREEVGQANTYVQKRITYGWASQMISGRLDVVLAPLVL